MSASLSDKQGFVRESTTHVSRVETLTNDSCEQTQVGSSVVKGDFDISLFVEVGQHDESIFLQQEGGGGGAVRVLC